MRSLEASQYLIRAIDAFDRDLVIITPDFRIVAANRHAAEKWEHRLIGQICHQAIYDRDAPCDDCPAVEALRTGRPVMYSLTVNLVSGIRKGSCFPILSGSGDRIDALAMVDYDISRLTSLEQRLRRTNMFLRNILRSAVDGIIAADMSGKIIIFNEAAAEVTGYSVAEALDALYIWQIYPGEGKAAARRVMRDLRGDDYGGSGKLNRYHVDIRGKNGQRIPISLYAALIYEEGHEVASIGFFHDLRDRLRMKTELERAQVQLMQAEKMASLGKLAAGVAHQLNNPLGSITLFARLMLEEHDLPEAARDDLERILSDAERCRDTVKELLEFARQTRQQIQPQDINQALERTLFLLQNQTLFHNIRIVKVFAPDLPPVRADIQQLNHLFMNLILNAAQAMQGSGQLTIRTLFEVEAKTAVIEVGDTGPGIPPEVLPHIFEPFFTTKEEGQGTGLGLSMVYSIVENHGGRTEVDSSPESGTTFRVRLPVGGPPSKGEDSDEPSLVSCAGG
ncbi:MAG TPA: PAS domain-containing protein [Desulfobacteraceae bacterium]|nr:PAS domain-containing protein [Desulfobacteraceae bacterium]